MTREEFISLIRSPETLNLKAISELEDITERYPYFQNAHLLLAKQYHGHQNIKYESYLRKAAAYAPDRERLYDLINTPVTTEIHMEADTQEVKKVSGPSSEADSETVIPVDDSGTKEQQKEDTLTDTVTNKPEEETVPSSDPAEILKRRLEEINSAIEQAGASSVNSVPEPAEESFESIPEGPNEETPESVTEISQDTSAPAEQEPDVRPLKKPVVNEKHSFVDWLRSRSVPVIPAEQVGERYSGIEKDAGQKPEEDGENEDILDKFIKSEPRIIPAKAQFYSPGNMARKSVQSNSDVVSETLAAIYARQGNIDKAIESYKTLSLKFPEKSSYFAGLIDKLREEKDPGTGDQ
jgi:hypothetical protein